MKLRVQVTTVYAALVVTMLIIASCGGGGGTGPSVEVSLTGTYQGSFGNDTANFTTTQSGDSVTGTYTLGSGDSGNFAGTTSPAEVVIGHQATQLKLTGRMTSLRRRGTCDIDTLATSGGASIAGSFRCSDGRRGNMSLSRTSAPPPPASSPFQGSLTGRYSGTCNDGGTEQGTFSMTIDASGGVSGSGSGTRSGPSGTQDKSGPISGTVDINGNFSGTSGVHGGPIQGKFTRSGNALSVSGSYSGGGGKCQGTFSGSGTASQ